MERWLECGSASGSARSDMRDWNWMIIIGYWRPDYMNDGMDGVGVWRPLTATTTTTRALNARH